MKKLTLLLGLFLVSNLFAQTFTITPHASGFYNPVCITQAPGDDRLYVVERDGAIRIVNTDGSLVAGDWLNIAPRVYDNNNEQGLLGLAFDPDYQTNGYFYVNYTIDSAGSTVDEDTRVSRFSRSTINPLIADPASEVVLLRIGQPYWNHNGGGLAFGPDGYLYVGMGDGGSGGDPGNRAQNPLNNLGKMLRLNVDAPTYTCPVSNPYYGVAGYNPEIYTLGMRNPWRFNFDRLSGDLWIGDVGQDTYEEINHAENVLSNGGENYGWRCYEGMFPYNLSGCAAIGTYFFPKANIPQASGPMCSITMGEVYRGANWGALYNKLLFTDYCYDYIWTLTYDTAGAATYDTTRHNNVAGGNFFVTLVQDNRGFLYVANFADDDIYKLNINICTPAAVIETGLNRTVTCDGNPIQLNSAPGTGLDYQWLLNGSPIGGAVDSTYMASTAGNYQLIVTNPTCGVNGTDTSAVLTLGAATTPTVSLTSPTADTTCLSVVNLALTGTPSGGEYLSPYVTATGSFYVQVAGLGFHDVIYRYLDAGGCTGYDTLTLEVVDCSAGIEHSDYFGPVTVYPNPADDYTILSLNATSDAQINLDIVSVDGKLVQQRILQVNAGVNNININTSNLSSGIYFMQMNDGIHYFAKKIVIQ